MSQTPAMLELRDVAFAYADGRFRLDGASFGLDGGELVGLLGPNGSGKSTLVKLIVRLLVPAAGEIRLAGRPAGDFRRAEYVRRVAYLPQEMRPAFAFTALETVMMGRSPYMGAMGFESETDYRKARAALERVDASAFAGVLLGELSGGERQRVHLARALAQEADLLVLDEPASFLDIKHQYELYELLRRLAREEGRACLCVSHDVNVAAAYCDRLVLLRAGRVAAVGEPAEVITAEALRQVYGVEADLVVRPGRPPAVLPRAAR